MVFHELMKLVIEDLAKIRRHLIERESIAFLTILAKHRIFEQSENLRMAIIN